MRQMLFVLPTFLVPGCLSLQPSAGVHVRPALKLQTSRTTELRMETAAAWIAAASMFNQEAAAMPIGVCHALGQLYSVPLTRVGTLRSDRGYRLHRTLHSLDELEGKEYDRQC